MSTIECNIRNPLDYNHKITLTNDIEFFYISKQDNQNPNVTSHIFMKCNDKKTFGMIAYGEEADKLLLSLLDSINFNVIELERRGVKDEIMAFRINRTFR